ncbi:ion transporter [Planktosalinus lacus]|uniref:Ion transporter n=1 Tax=Planktosalinus lacus TaxID=1526573 RepID=A0A8J2VAE5_9FLAO|nr:ion transporter [Planktosalinus lacus]GGD91543.1 ion transporter [Planktosalinus lacus]
MLIEEPKSKIDKIRQRIYIVIYGTNTKAGKIFDIFLLIFILLSVLAVMLESVQYIDEQYHAFLIAAEWFFTILFSIEYILRIFSTKKPWKYIFSFYGIIDFLAILPMYLSFFFTGSNLLGSIRALRLLRLFRVLKLANFIGEATNLKAALKASRAKIIVFLFTVLIIAMVVGTLMYLIEGPESGYTSIPRGIYWTVVTLTTVGFGDIYPQTALGQFLAMFVMITGYGIIAVPTGIVSAEFAKQKGNKTKSNPEKTNIACPVCNTEIHNENASYCYECGSKLKV